MLEGRQPGAMEVVQAVQHGPASRTSYAVSLRNLVDTIINGHPLTCRTRREIAECQRIVQRRGLERELHLEVFKPSQSRLDASARMVSDQPSDQLMALRSEVTGTVERMEASCRQLLRVSDVMKICGCDQDVFQLPNAGPISLARRPTACTCVHLRPRGATNRSAVHIDQPTRSLTQTLYAAAAPTHSEPSR